MTGTARSHVIGLFLLVAATFAVAAYALVSSQHIGSSIAAHIAAGDVSTFYPSTDLERSRLATLYERSGFRPLWVDAAGRTARGREAVLLLENSDEDGLDPTRYIGSLDDLAAALDAARSPTAEQISRYDIALSAAMLRYLQHLRHGAIDPRAVGIRLRAPADQDDVVTCLRAGLERNRIAGAIDCARPALDEYERLRVALKRYRTLAPAHERWTRSTSIKHPGEPLDRASQLRDRLTALGDLAAAPSDLDAGVYPDSLVEAVKRFQRRHGLDADGVIGPATWRELSVSLVQRARQIELALERLRWLPPVVDAPLLVLNIPAFELRGWDHGWRGAPAITMKAIVGRAVTPTPSFGKTIQSVIFRPYWNVPSSIVRRELLPAIRKDRGLLTRDDLELVRGNGDDADVVAATDENLERLAEGGLRLRQRPGPKNALGLIKFMLPNEEQVYLHGTPLQGLFGRSRRDFSHGCVRVEDPVALAEWVFAGHGEGRRDRIMETIANPAIISRQVRLQTQVQVLFVYTTAETAPDGSVRFAPDIYNRDAALDLALRRRPSTAK